MRPIKIFLLFSLALTLIANAHGLAPNKRDEASALEKKAAPKKLLFVGNSFSFYNNGIHNHLGSLIRANGEWKSGENRHKLLTYSGGHLFEQIISIAGIFEVDTRGFDAVVLQGHSNEPIHPRKKERFEAALKRAAELVRSQSIEPILFMTWGYAGDNQMAIDLADAYIEQGKQLGLRVAPVGLAFQAAARTLPNINLYVPDVLGATGGEITYRKEIKHPSVAGTYLAACVFYSLLFDKSPEGNPFISSLSKQEALALQALSWRVVKTFSEAK